MQTLNHLIAIAAIIITVGLFIGPIAIKAISNINAVSLQLESIHKGN
jgi:hypothetical protein